MPTYDYECEACKGHFEIFHSIQETRKKCPRCGASRLRRQIGAGSGFLFRGTGFYITDYRSSEYVDKSKAESSGASSGKGSEPSPGDSKASKKESKVQAS